MHMSSITNQTLKMSGWEAIITILEYILPWVLEDPWLSRVIVIAKIVVAVVVMVLAVRASWSNWV